MSRSHRHSTEEEDTETCISTIQLWESLDFSLFYVLLHLSSKSTLPKVLTEQIKSIK